MPSSSTPRLPWRSPQGGRAARPGGLRRDDSGSGFGFFLFLLVNAALFVRPADVIPALQGVEIYRYLLLGTVLVSGFAVLSRLSPVRLERQPIDLFVLLLLPVIFLSHLAHSKAADGAEEAFNYFKIVLYYFLLVSLVTTPKRMKIFISCLLIFAAITTVLSILDFVKIIQLPRLVDHSKLAHRHFIDENRMYGPGIFNDPNDICVMIGTSLLLLLGKFMDKAAGFSRILWTPILVIFLVGFALTQSRGGLLALLVGSGFLVVLRWGWVKVMLLGGLAVPALLAMLAGRMAKISSTEETGQERIQLWSAGLEMLRANPIFGVGHNCFHLEAGHVAHNSYVQAFGDTGLPGGLLFLGMVLVAIWGLYRLTSSVRVGRQVIQRTILDPHYRYLHPFLAGAVVCYATGMMTLSLNNLVTTYTVLGLSSVFQEHATTWPEGKPLRLDMEFLTALFLLSMMFLVGLYLFIRLTFNPG